MKDHNELIRKLEKIANDMDWPLMAEAAEAIRELQVDAARYRWLRDNCVDERYDGEKRVRFNCDFDNWDNVDAAIDAAMKGSPNATDQR